MKIIYNSIKHLSLSFLVLQLGFLTSGFAQTTTVDLGTLATTTRGGGNNTQFPNNPLSHAFDGIIDDENNHFRQFSTVPGTVRWGVDPLADTDIDINSVESFTFTIQIYTGASDITGDIFKFYLKADDLARDFSEDFITDYDNLVTVDRFSGNGFLSVDVDSTGLITAANGDGHVRHTLTFTTDNTVRNFQLTIPVRASGDNLNVWGLDEIVTSATAVIVPEPSTHALLLGLGCLGFRMIRRKRSTKEV
jgi:hypothetical protein